MNKQHKVGDVVGVFNKEAPKFTFNGQTGKIKAIKYEIEFSGGVCWTIDEKHIVDETGNAAHKHGISIEDKAIEAYKKVTEPKTKRAYKKRESKK